MKNKGFTLMELLGVIVIIAILTILVFPSITNSVKNSSDKTDKLTEELIFNASDLFISNHDDLFNKFEGKKFEIELKDLVEEGLLVSPIKYSDQDDITNNKCIEVTYNNGYKYSLKEKGTCGKLICKAVTLAEEGGYTIGDKYSCKVDPDGDPLIFYVLTAPTQESPSVDLIMENNLQGETIWGSSSKPTNVLNKLSTLTSSWTNLNKTEYTTFDNLSSTPPSLSTPIQLRARLPYYSEINQSALTKLFENNTTNGYWTFTSNSTVSNAYYVSNALGTAAISVTKGIRPVITVPKSGMWNYTQVQPLEPSGPPKVYSNGEIVYFDVVRGHACPQSEYQKSKNSLFMPSNLSGGDYTNSATGYFGTGGYNAAYTCDSNGFGCQNSCLKFYAYGDLVGNTTLNLLLDHNTIATCKWTKNTASDGPSDLTNYVLERLDYATKDWKGTLPQQNYVDPLGGYTVHYFTDNYKYKARLIDYQELLNITNGATSGIPSEIKSWLFDRVSDSSKSCGGGNNSEVSKSGYWTSTSSSINDSTVKYVSYTSCQLGYNYVGSSFSTYAGVRPVITVAKEKLDEKYFEHYE